MKNWDVCRGASNAAKLGLLGSLLLLPAIPVASAASPQNLLISGGNYSSNAQFAYLGAVVPVAGGSLGHGFFVSPFFGWVRYTFQRNGVQFTGTEPAGSLGVGYAWTTDWLNLSLSVAGGYSNTSVSPYVPPDTFHGVQYFAEPEVYAQLKLPAGITWTAIGGYLTGLRSYFVSSYQMVPITPAIAIGPEEDFGGGINYRNQAFALRVNYQVTPGLNVALSGGEQTNIPGSYHPYVAVALNVPFP